MWFWIVSSIAGSILGSATNSWFEKTALGRWFYKKVENIYNWAAKRYGFEVLKSEEKWKKKYPNICLLYTSPSPRDATLSRMPSSA